MCVVAKLQQASACNMDTTPTQPHRNVNRLQPATQIPLEPNHTETPTGFSLQHGYYSNPATPKLQHTSNQEHTTNVVIEQNSRKLLMMDILVSETCWAHKKWNKIASDIKLVFYSSTITMMHGPINIIWNNSLKKVINTFFSHSPGIWFPDRPVHSELL